VPPDGRAKTRSGSVSYLRGALIPSVPDALSVLELETGCEIEGGLARDLDRLRSAKTISAFKEDVLAQASETTDQLFGKAKDSLSDGMQNLWHEVKARAAANPAAALAIGAGLAWRMVQQPPIASVLVGIGLLSLWRTDPRHSAAGADLVARSVQFFETAKGKAEDAVRRRKLPLRQCGSAVKRCFLPGPTAQERSWAGLENSRPPTKNAIKSSWVPQLWRSRPQLGSPRKGALTHSRSAVAPLLVFSWRLTPADLPHHGLKSARSRA
jgi:hypothetical protein